jgi:DNA-binding HxlR family transcriptional regulator
MTITLETTAILVSIVSFVVSVLAFFAAVKFYRDGVSLQRASREALTKVAERNESLEEHVGGVFDKTLDATLGRRYELGSNFEELERQLFRSRETMLVEIRNQVSAMGDLPEQRLRRTVEEQMSLLKEKIQEARESAEEVADSSLPQREASIILESLNTVNRPLGLFELREEMEKRSVRTSTWTLKSILKDLITTNHVDQLYDHNHLKYGLTDAGRALAEFSRALHGA